MRRQDDLHVESDSAVDPEHRGPRRWHTRRHPAWRRASAGRADLEFPYDAEQIVAKMLVTGAAGFIGFHVAQRLLARGDDVVGLDNLNDYYDVGLKQARLAQLEAAPRFDFRHLDLADRAAMAALFAQEGFEYVIHLGAQAGVRYSLINPQAYVDSNLVGFMNVLEGCRHHPVRHLVYASSSSVYGANTRMPFSVHDNVDHPVSLYAATKKANELMAHTYSHLYDLPTTGLRFFTVYGPWGRPDMALFIFTRAILAGEPIDLFNYGRMRRDFTYIDDIVEGVIRITDHVAQPDPAWSSEAPDAGQEPGAVPALQHRQSSAGRAGLSDRGPGAQARAARPPESASHPAGRRTGDLCGCGRSDARCRLQAVDVDRGGHLPLRGLVPRLLWAMSGLGHARPGLDEGGRLRRSGRSA